MSASDNLSPVQFDFYPADKDDHAAGWHNHEIHAFAPGDQHVGRLAWDARDGDVQHVHVDEGSRRQGVATGMWKYAQGLQGVQRPRHAPSDERTDAGNAWAKSVKGPGLRRTFQ